jgi:hypothetical protein
MTRRLLVLALATALASLTGIPMTSAFGAERCVGARPGCAVTLQAALDAAADGDTIRLAAGTFAGGATVTKSVAIVGAGQRATVVRGGGPVLTIGAMFDPAPPTVSIRDLTITGGRTTSSPQSVEFVGQEGVLALGGGIEIPPGADFAPGATVTVARTTVTDNRAAPSATVASGLDACPDCPFALASGGGIDSWGTLTITDSTVSANRVGSASGLSTLASDAEGGGVSSRIGPLTILRTRIADNSATATAPNGRFAEAGGVFAFDAPFTMRDSSVIANHADLAAALPDGIDMLANAGGIHIADSVPSGEITRSLFTGNSVAMTNSVGGATAFSGALHIDSQVNVRIVGSLITANRVSAATLGSSTGLAHADSGGVQLFGAMVRTRVSDNTVTATSAGGDAEAMAGGSWVLFGDLTDSQLRDNRLTATAPNGQARVRGGGAIVDTDPDHPGTGGLTLTDSVVKTNVATADGASNLGQGGGIFDGELPPFGPFGGPLALTSSKVTANRLRGPSGATLQGGGVFLDGQTLTQTDSVIARNRPDQCFGCTAGASGLAARSATSLPTRPGAAAARSRYHTRQQRSARARPLVSRRHTRQRHHTRARGHRRPRPSHHQALDHAHHPTSPRPAASFGRAARHAASQQQERVGPVAARPAGASTSWASFAD